MSGFILEEDVSVILSLLVNKYYKEMQWEEVGYVLVFAWYVNVWKRYIKGTFFSKSMNLMKTRYNNINCWHVLGGRTQCQLLMTFLPISAQITTPGGMSLFPISPPTHSFDPILHMNSGLSYFVIMSLRLLNYLVNANWTRIRCNNFCVLRPGDMIAMICNYNDWSRKSSGDLVQYYYILRTNRDSKR